MVNVVCICPFTFHIIFYSIQMRLYHFLRVNNHMLIYFVSGFCVSLFVLLSLLFWTVFESKSGYGCSGWYWKRKEIRFSCHLWPVNYADFHFSFLNLCLKDSAHLRNIKTRRGWALMPWAHTVYMQNWI